MASNAIGMVTASQVNGWLVASVAPGGVLLRFGLLGATTAGLVLLRAVSLGEHSASLVVPPLFTLMTSNGFVMALALADHPKSAGTAAALLGVFQFTAGAVSTPLTGLAGKASAVPMAIVIATVCSAALTAITTLTR